ncbi:protoporphyrinogen oxidase [Acidithiobacillus ferrivorans]|uniref:Protoporphyrinogen oxidase n=1 Tax=Acidithiobacillus ferrivorans TaxID=160808 RepID=A0A7T4WFW2_9PROT|nr:protoporphyrinogen oxidase [Acidithiobacillus ferrivorans]QQD73687.1 protoporphyrinogen oxidase [Acidithiobacillus ferrivorans]
MDDVIIIGAGISGLATAYFLRKQGWSPLLLEAAAKPGGNLQSRQEEGYRRDMGPNSLMLKGHIVPEWLRELRLEEDIVEANPLAKRRYILNRHRQPVALGPGVLFGGGLLSWRGRLRLLGEPFRSPRRMQDSEESVADFVRRRLGEEALTWLVDPFISGVFAGNPARLSVQATLPRLIALEQDGGSLLRGALRARNKKSPDTPKTRLISFHEGLQTLPLRVASALGDALRCNTPVEHLGNSDGNWQVSSGSQTWQSKRLILALPAGAAARLLAPTDAALAHELDAIPYPAVGSLSIGFQRMQVQHPLDGFGMLIPRVMGLETLGVLFSSTLFPGRAPADQVLLTAFIGGSQNDISGRDDDDLLATALREICPLLGISGKPVFSRCQTWPKAIPQYEIGHLERVKRIDALSARHPGLYFRANWREGVALGDCMEEAYRFSQDVGWQR